MKFADSYWTLFHIQDSRWNIVSCEFYMMFSNTTSDSLRQRCPTLSPFATCGDRQFKCGDKLDFSNFIFLAITKILNHKCNKRSDLKSLILTIKLTVNINHSKKWKKITCNKVFPKNVATKKLLSPHLWRMPFYRWTLRQRQRQSIFLWRTIKF